jgi:hypothetical protein
MLTIICISIVLILFHALMRDLRDVESSSSFFRAGIDEENDGNSEGEKT